MNKIYTIAFWFQLFWLTNQAYSQNLLWAKQLGGATSGEYGYAIAVDVNGNVYTSGSFHGTADFDPGAGTYNLTSSGGSTDIFVSKLDASGNFVWAKQLSGINLEESYAIVVDSAGNIYTTGRFYGAVDFDPGPGTFNLITGGTYEIFVSKLDSNGNFVWAKRLGGSSTDYGYGIVVDYSGNVYTTGSFGGVADFDPGTGVYNLTSAGIADIFVSKLDSSGNFVWAKRFGSLAFDEGRSITLDPYGNVHTTGYFQGPVDFDPGIGVYNLTSAGGSADIFVSKLDSSGNFIWAKHMGGSGWDISRSIFVDSSGNVFTTGYFSDTADFDPNAGAFYLTNFSTWKDIFVSKLDSTGNFIWASHLGGAEGDDDGYSIVTDAIGNVYSTGIFYDTADFDPGIGIYNLISTPPGSDNAFISKLDYSGNFLSAGQLAGINCRAYSLTIDMNGNVYATGEFYDTTDFDPGIGIYNLTTLGGPDIFVIKLSDSPTAISELEHTSYFAPSAIFPNPATNHLSITLRSDNKNAEVTIIDITGKIIYKTTATETRKIEVNTKDFAGGIYVVRIQTADFIETKKLIVAK